MDSSSDEADDDLNTLTNTLQIDGKSLRNAEFRSVYQNFNTGCPSYHPSRVFYFSERRLVTSESQNLT